MKRYLLSGLTIVLSTLAMASSAGAQTHIKDLAADLNGDGVVTLSELVSYNRDQRGN